LQNNFYQISTTTLDELRGQLQQQQPQVVAEHTAVMGERVDDVLHAVEIVDGALLLPVQLDGFEQMLALNVEHL